MAEPLPRQRRFVKEADNLRFQLAYLIAGAEVLGDSMDAPVRFRKDIEAVTLGSLHRFLKRYDEARQEVDPLAL